MLPTGYVGLRVGPDVVEIIEHRKVRRWWFWKPWRVRTLASAKCRVDKGDRVELIQRGRQYDCEVNDRVVLVWKRPRLHAVWPWEAGAPE